MSYYPSYATLKCFDAAARHLSFTLAARELHLTQGAVSHHIQKLEQQLSVQLFDRSNGKLVLTEIGATYWYEIRPALTCIERATDQLRHAKTSNVVVRVAVPPTFAEYWLMSRLNQFTLNHPESQLQIKVCSGDMIEKSGADIAFELSQGHYPGFESMQVLPLKYRPYIRTDLPCMQAFEPGVSPTQAQWVQLLKQFKPLHSSRLENWPEWLQHKGLLDELGLDNVRAGPRYATASLALQAALDGIGIALLPDYVVQRMPESAQLTCLDPVGWTSRMSYYMFWDKSKEQSGATRDFIVWARAEFQNPAAD